MLLLEKGLEVENLRIESSPLLFIHLTFSLIYTEYEINRTSSYKFVCTVSVVYPQGRPSRIESQRPTALRVSPATPRAILRTRMATSPRSTGRPPTTSANQRNTSGLSNPPSKRLRKSKAYMYIESKYALMKKGDICILEVKYKKI